MGGGRGLRRRGAQPSAPKAAPESSASPQQAGPATPAPRAALPAPRSRGDSGDRAVPELPTIP